MLFYVIILLEGMGMEKVITLTKDEVEMLEVYLFRKQINLENSNLTDSRCYSLICSIRRKLKNK